MRKVQYTLDLTTDLQKEVTQLSSLVKTLKDRCKFLGFHTYRNNVQIMGKPGGKRIQIPNLPDYSLLVSKKWASFSEVTFTVYCVAYQVRNTDSYTQLG